MKTITVIKGTKVFRWRGGTFIAVWEADRADEHVPDDMYELPPSVNRTHANRYDIEDLCQRYLAERTEPNTPV